MKTKDTTSASFFEEKYQRSGDPWAFASSAYEQQRYQAIYDAVSFRHYSRAFEPGCSIGVLTEKLAAICDHIEAIDLSATAIAHARERTKHLSHVNTTCGGLPAFIPDGMYDLIVFSEIGYYFSEDGLFAVGQTLTGRLSSSGVFLAAHWLGESPDHLLPGDRVHEILAEVGHLALQHSERRPGFRLDLWQRS